MKCATRIGLKCTIRIGMKCTTLDLIYGKHPINHKKRAREAITASLALLITTISNQLKRQSYYAYE
jgi:hypothetical protein